MTAADHLSGQQFDPGTGDSKSAFARCFRVASAYTKHVRSTGGSAELVQLAGSPKFPNAHPEWQEIPPEHRMHYVTKTDDGYVDWTRRQFDPKADYPHAMKRHGWKQSFPIENGKF